MKSHDAMIDHERKVMMPWMIMMKGHNAMDDHGSNFMMPWMIMGDKS